MSLHDRAIAVHVRAYCIHERCLPLSIYTRRGLIGLWAFQITSNTRCRSVFVIFEEEEEKIVCVCRVVHINYQVVYARAYSVQDNIINFDCDHVLFSIRNQHLRTRIIFCVVFVVVACIELIPERVCASVKVCVSCYCCFWCSFTLRFVYSNTQNSVRSFWLLHSLLSLSQWPFVLTLSFDMLVESFCSDFDSIWLLLLYVSDTSVLQFEEAIWRFFSDGECVMSSHDVIIICGSNWSQTRSYLFSREKILFRSSNFIADPLIITIACLILHVIYSFHFGLHI